MHQVNRTAAAVAEVAIAALCAAPGVDLMDGLLDALRVAVGADTAGFYMHEPQGWSAPLYLSPAEVWQRVPFHKATTAAAAALHPGIRHCLVHRPLAPFALTDVVSELTWWNSELGTLMCPDWGRNYQFAIPVPQRNRSAPCWVWVLGRERQNFSGPDRDVAAALQPLLSAVAHRQEIRQQTPGPDRIGICGLTEREVTVLGLLAHGLSAAAAGHHLGTSPRTIHKHTERIYRKLSVTNRHHALASARELGIL